MRLHSTQYSNFADNKLLLAITVYVMSSNDDYTETYTQHTL